LAVAGFACSSAAPSPERVGAAASDIQGGTIDTTHNFAVAVCGGAEGGPGGGNNCQILCSGALIAPNLVMTARHCVDNVSSATVDCSDESFGPRLAPASQYFVTTDPNVYDPGAPWYSVAEIITPTEPAFCGNDLSLVILGSNVPRSAVPTFVTPEIWYPIYAHPFSAAETAIGYGLDSPEDTTSGGTRRILQDIPIDCVPEDPVGSMRCGPADESGVAPKEFEAGNGLCAGDSGSSAYDQKAFSEGSFLSLGVLSRGGASGDICEGSIYTQLYPWQDLILRAASEAATRGGYPLPSWTTRPAGVDGGWTPPEEGGADVEPEEAPSRGTQPLGSTCTTSAVCSSGDCVTARDGDGSVCAEPCSDAGACPSGYSCVSGSCLAGPRVDAGTGSGMSGQSGGCALSHGAPENGTVWFALLGVVAIVARRRPRA
jgi:MYXO-CTERM domain-containing protein